MKKVLMTAAATLALGVAGAAPATTNVVQYTSAQKDERAARIAAWRETWEKMTPEQREAHRAEAARRLQEQRAATGEVSRTKDKDGNIVITYRDGSVRVHKLGK